MSRPSLKKVFVFADKNLDRMIALIVDYINKPGLSLPVYPDNATATAGGLTVGMEYRTATGARMVVY